MKPHLPNRVQGKPDRTRRQLRQGLATGSARHASRRLLCEQLERRYAMHGMGWFDSIESVQTDDLRESTFGFEAAVSLQFTEGRNHYIARELSARPEPKLDPDWLEYSNGDSEDEHSRTDECTRMSSHGMIAEQEPPDFVPGAKARPINHEPGLPGQIPNSNFAAVVVLVKPVVIDALVVAAKPDRAPADARGPQTDSSIQRTTNTVPNIGLREFVDLYAPGRANAPLTNSNPRSVEANSSAYSSRPEPTPSLTSARADAKVDSSSMVAPSVSAVASMSQRAALAMNSSVEVTSTGHDSTETTSVTSTGSDSWQRVARPKSNESATLQNGGADGFDQLRSVIDKLASEPPTDKVDVGIDRRPGRGLNSEFSSTDTASRRRMINDDGMLELAAATDKLIVEAMAEAQPSADNDVGYRTQLLASLELNREFELAGQSVRGQKVVENPAYRVNDSNSPAEIVAMRDEDLATASKPLEESAAAEGTIWQRALLPLSFLALGGLLIRSRKKYRAGRPV